MLLPTSLFMKNSIILSVLLLLVNSLFAQSKKSLPLNPPPRGEMEGAFLGQWKGKLQWMVAGKPTKEFSMQLIIQPADTVGQYTWQIIYGDSGKVDNRPYLLKPVDTAKGYWVIDERDGIVLDSYLHGNSLHGAFTVTGNTIVDNYTVNGDEMNVEFFSIKLDQKNTSGKGTDETPFVDSYKITSYQVGVLKRVK